jgi:hypothetical protein
MLTRVLALIVTAYLVGAGLHTTALSAWSQIKDLDTFSDAELMTDLIDEIDDILEGHDPDEIVDEEAVQDVLDALNDGGDTGDESEIDFEDLVAEMDEAQTTVQDVVEGALEVQLAGGRRGEFTVAARHAAPPRRKEAPSRVARALVAAIKSKGR